MKKVGIIGAGLMGSAITQKLSMAGYLVELMDKDPLALDKAYKYVLAALEDAAKKNIITQEVMEDAITLVEFKNTIEDMSEDLDLIIEAATEEAKIKADIFKEIDDHCFHSTIIATNTSCLSISELAENVQRKDKFLGLHFFYPAEKNKLVEIIPTSQTSHKTIYKIAKLVEDLEKIAIHVNDRPGFCINRFFVPFMNEAVKLLEQGHCSAYEIDLYAKKAFQCPMGPFEIINKTGSKLAFESISELHRKLGDAYLPSTLLEDLAKHDGLFNLDITDQNCTEEMQQDLIERLYATVISKTIEIINEKVATPTEIHIGARIGLGWKNTPIKLIEKLGAQKMKSLLQQHSQTVLNEEILSLLVKPEISNIKTIQTKMGKNNIAYIKFWRPDALNAFNRKLFEELDSAIDRFSSDQQIKAIVFEGYEKVFSAGADLKYFIECLENNKLDEKLDYTKFAHTVLQKIADCPKVTVAKVDGIAIGGGVELALCCDLIFATDRSTFQLPETAIGIVPGFGGTQNLPKKVGKDFAKYIILSNKALSAVEATSLRLVDRHFDNKVSLQNFIDKNIPLYGEELIEKIKNLSPQFELPNDLKRELLFYKDFETLLSGKLVSKKAEQIQKSISEKPKECLLAAEKLISYSEKATLEDGLQEEYKYISYFFNQPEITKRLKNVFKRR